MREVDVAIIGAGTAGLSARREVVKLTTNYVVIDDGILGTTCARVGCMPSKALIEAANLFAKSKHLHKLGVDAYQSPPPTAALMEHVRALRDRFVRAVHRDMEEWTQEHLLRKRARFVGPNELDLGDERIRARRIVVAAGTRPIIPKEWHPFRRWLVDTDAFFELPELPRKIAVIGTGVIGIELGQALARWGLEVTAIGRGRANVAGLTDPEIVDYAWRTLAEEMPILTTGVRGLSAQGNQLRIDCGDKQIIVDKALVAIGREPDLRGLGIEKAGVKLDEKGAAEFDRGTYRIPGTDIYLVGDANRDRPVLHEAADEGRIAGYNAVRDRDQCFARRVPLAITFCAPNAAIVGKSHRQLLDSKADFVAGEVSYEGQGRALVKMENKGLMKVYAERTSGKILGAELFAPEGEHMAHLLAWAIDAGLTVHDALAKPFYHPVIEEGLRTALRQAATRLANEPPALELLRCEDPPVGSYAKPSAVSE